MKDYSTLEGAEVVYSQTKHGVIKSVDCFVAYCEYDVGVTVVLKDDPRVRAFCLTNPVVQAQKSGGSSIDLKTYWQLFIVLMAAVRRGEIDLRFWAATESLIGDSSRKCPGGVPADKCAFT